MPSLPPQLQPNQEEEEEEGSVNKGHPPPNRRSTRHRLDWLEHDGNLSPRRHHYRLRPAVAAKTKQQQRQRQYESSLYWTKTRWMFFGIILGSFLTQFLHVLTMPSSMMTMIHLDNVGRHEAAAFGPFANSPHQIAAAAAASRYLKLRNDNNEPAVVTSSKTDPQEPQISPPPKALDSNATAKAGNLTTTTQPPNKKKKNDNKQPQQQVPHYIANKFDPVFVDLPPPPKLEKDDYVSACLLIKDDNHWLIEWLAYHYFALPLKELVVVVDPDSKTTPKHIFQRWTSRNLMNITVWEDKDFMPKKVQAKASFFDNNTKVMMHRVRQTNFIKKCIPSLRKKHAKWVMLIDTDEFVLPSYASWYFLNVTNKIPRIEPGNVLKMLKYHEYLTGTNHTCVYMPRFFFGARETPAAQIAKFFPKDFNTMIDPQMMLTQRFLYRDPRQNPNGKNLINMKRVPSIQQFESVHKITSVCPDVMDMWTINQQHHAIIRIQHYLGTLEQHFFRDDPRTHSKEHPNNNATITQQTTTNKKKNKKKAAQKKKPGTYIVRGLDRYNKLNATAIHKDDGMMGWVVGFVRQVGKKTAYELLKGVGEVGIE